MLLCRMPLAAIPRLWLPSGHTFCSWRAAELLAALGAFLLEAHCLERMAAKAWCCVALLAGDGTEARVSRH